MEDKSRFYAENMEYAMEDPDAPGNVLCTQSALLEGSLDIINERLSDINVRIVPVNGGFLLSVPVREEDKDLLNKPPKDSPEAMTRKINPLDLREFTDTGLVMFVNMILQIFGFSIGYHLDRKSGITSNLYVCRSKYRGFSADSQQRAHCKLAAYLLEHIAELEKETKLP